MQGWSLAGLREQRRDLRLVALKKNDLNRELRLLDEVASHTFPDRDDLGS